MLQETGPYAIANPLMIQRSCCAETAGTRQWYAIKCKPHHERIAQASLTRSRIPTFYPEVKELKVIRRRKQMCVGALFPGYIFAKFCADHEQRTVGYSRGVSCIVSFGQTPAVVDEEIIQAIKIRLHEGFVVMPEPSPFVPGQAVRIQEGPLQGIEAVFGGHLPGYQRAVVLLKAISYQARLVVNLESIVNI